MCGRYTLDKKAEQLAKRFNLATIDAKLKENYNVAPGQTMPVITQDDKGKRLVMMQWGIPRIFGKDRPPKELINTRSEKAFDPFWRTTVASRRCLIPATGFYEWKTLKDGKHPFFIHPKEEPLFAFAGIWDTWKDRDGRIIETYSIMTTEPNKEMRTIHNRMPVILHPEDEASWIEPSNDTRDSLEPLLRPFEDDGLELFEVSRDVNVTRNNSNELIYPLNSQ